MAVVASTLTDIKINEASGVANVWKLSDALQVTSWRTGNGYWHATVLS